jgi:hypothetical protein
MNKCSIIIVITGIALVLGSCSNKRFLIAPEFTNIEKVSKIETGMSVERVNSILNISPYDAYILDQHNLTLVYNYRIKERRVPITNYGEYVKLYDDAVNKSIHTEAAQKAGTVFYTEWRKLYVHFKKRKCVGFITGPEKLKPFAELIADANSLEVMYGSIRSIRENPKTILIDVHLVNENLIIPLDENRNIVFYPRGEQGSKNNYFWLGLEKSISDFFRINKKKK